MPAACAVVASQHGARVQIRKIRSGDATAVGRQPFPALSAIGRKPPIAATESDIAGREAPGARQRAYRSAIQRSADW